MFTEGFEKTALGVPSPGKAIGTVRGALSRTGKAIKGSIGRYGKQETEKAIQAYRGQKSIPHETGTALYGARARKAQAAGKQAPNFKDSLEGASQAKSDVYKRKTRMEESRVANKPSFARKHPFLTAGGLYLGARAAMGGGDENKQQPQAYQQGY